MKNELVIENFTEGIKTKKIINGNLFSELHNNNLVLYSYGYHFPIGLKLINGFVLNKDKYSQSTSRHQNLLKNCAYGEIIFKNTDELISIIEKDFKEISEVIEEKI